MPIAKSFAFESIALPTNNEQALQAYVKWIKCQHVLWTAFPTVNQSVYYKKVQLFGVQRFWTSTWFDRFHSAATLGESTVELNECWASLLLYHLDQLWPHLDDLTDDLREQLEAIHQFTNRVKGARFHGYGIAVSCIAPQKLEGFVDLYEDIGTNDEITKWLSRNFLPRSGNR